MSWSWLFTTLIPSFPNFITAVKRDFSGCLDYIEVIHFSVVCRCSLQSLRCHSTFDCLTLYFTCPLAEPNTKRTGVVRHDLVLPYPVSAEFFRAELEQHSLTYVITETKDARNYSLVTLMSSQIKERSPSRIWTKFASSL